jgi:hypothetical protein
MMKWNTFFWAGFATAGTALIALMSADFSGALLAVSVILSAVGLFKLGEDRAAMKKNPFKVKVKKELLNRLK